MFRDFFFRCHLKNNNEVKIMETSILNSNTL